MRFFSAHGVSALLQAQQTAADVGAAFLLCDLAPCVTYILATTAVLPNFALAGGPAAHRGDGRRRGRAPPPDP
ncbi:hypothetical protein DER29_0399 [Micromonospora sp. M71_S20]|nr:hypothetical protein DER29_0399 [Micromonospora sp. M71_S20]